MAPCCVVASAARWPGPLERATWGAEEGADEVTLTRTLAAWDKVMQSRSSTEGKK